MQELLYALLFGFAGFMWGSKEVQAPLPLIEWGLSDMQGKRLSMEDAFMHEMVSHDAKRVYPCFALFDGHGGPEASRDAALMLPKFLPKHLSKKNFSPNSFDKQITEALFATCAELDEMLQKTYINQGTTGLIALFAETKAYLAWVGDSRAVVFSQNGTISLATSDHKPTTPGELERIGAENITVTSLIQNADGYKWHAYRSLQTPLILNPGQKFLRDGPARLGGLSLSRSLGDYACKKSEPLITAVPDIEIAPIVGGDCMILACDGLWDVMSSQEAATYVGELLKLSLGELQIRYPSERSSEIKGKEAGPSEKLRIIARALRDRAYDLGSSDNISVMIITF